MGTIYYNFAVGETVWVIYDQTITESTILQVDLETDPTSIGTTNDKITYHVDLVDVCGEIVLHDQSEVFNSLQAAMDFIADETIPSNSNANNITYTYDPGATVWVFEVDKVLEGTVTQLSFNVKNISEVLTETTIYHVLPTNTEFSTLRKLPGLVFPTQAAALAYMDSL